MTSLRFCFDYLSPYAYLAWHAVRPLAARFDRTVEPVPILLAALLGRWGHKGPAEIPPKRIYVFKDVVRGAAAAGLPLEPPAAHPFNPLLALRVTALPQAAPARDALVTELFSEVWGGRRGAVSDPAVVEAAAERAGLPGRELVAAASAQAAKDRIRALTDEALAAGVFGVPSMLADGELFWGYDSLAHLERFLAGEDPVDSEALAQWSGLPASAKRR